MRRKIEYRIINGSCCNHKKRSINEVMGGMKKDSYGDVGKGRCRQGKTPEGRGFANLVKLRVGVGVGVTSITSLLVSTFTISCFSVRRCVVRVFEAMEVSDFVWDSSEMDRTKYE